MVWIISAKRSRYDHASAFAKFGFIDLEIPFLFTTIFAYHKTIYFAKM